MQRLEAAQWVMRTHFWEAASPLPSGSVKFGDEARVMSFVETPVADALPFESAAFVVRVAIELHEQPPATPLLDDRGDATAGVSIVSTGLLKTAKLR